MSYSPEAGCAVDRGAIVVATSEVGGASVDRRPHQEWHRSGPIDGCEPTLHRCCACDRVMGICEYDESAVTLTPRFHKNTAMGHNRLIDRLIVLAKRLQHQIGRLFEQTGAALYISEKKCHYTFRELLFHAKSIHASDDWSEPSHSL
jgi:hypothetical protein